MNILHVVAGYISGGASRGAFWLHQALQQRSIDSHFLIQGAGNEQLDSSVSVVADSFMNRAINQVRIRMDQRPLHTYPQRDGTTFSPSITGIPFWKRPEYKQADLVHLHWINNGFIKIEDLARIEKPIVWTLRDMWPLTGGCHYTQTCTRFTQSCGSCPALQSSTDNDLSRAIFNRKQRYYPKPARTHLVAISEWLKQQAAQSPLLKGYPISVINNGIDTSLFTPTPQNEARTQLGLPADTHIIAFGAIDATHDTRKGFAELKAAINQCDPTTTRLLVFGNTNEEGLADINVPYTSMGRLTSDELVTVYSAADVFVAPSLQEGFGKTVAEAMACGTPTVAFDSTGPSDIIEHQHNGYLATHGDSNDLYAGIQWVLQASQANPSMREVARHRIQTKFDIDIIASQYESLYRDILSTTTV